MLILKFDFRPILAPSHLRGLICVSSERRRWRGEPPMPPPDGLRLCKCIFPVISKRLDPDDGIRIGDAANPGPSSNRQRRQQSARSAAMAEMERRRQEGHDTDEHAVASLVAQGVREIPLQMDRTRDERDRQLFVIGMRKRLWCAGLLPSDVPHLSEIPIDLWGKTWGELGRRGYFAEAYFYQLLVVDYEGTSGGRYLAAHFNHRTLEFFVQNPALHDTAREEVRDRLDDLGWLKAEWATARRWSGCSDEEDTQTREVVPAWPLPRPSMCLPGFECDYTRVGARWSPPPRTVSVRGSLHPAWPLGEPWRVSEHIHRARSLLLEWNLASRSAASGNMLIGHHE